MKGSHRSEWELSSPDGSGRINGEMLQPLWPRTVQRVLPVLWIWWESLQQTPKQNSSQGLYLRLISKQSLLSFTNGFAARVLYRRGHYCRRRALWDGNLRWPVCVPSENPHDCLRRISLSFDSSLNTDFVQLDSSRVLCTSTMAKLNVIMLHGIKSTKGIAIVPLGWRWNQLFPSDGINWSHWKILDKQAFHDSNSGFRVQL